MSLFDCPVCPSEIDRNSHIKLDCDEAVKICQNVSQTVYGAVSLKLSDPPAAWCCCADILDKLHEPGIPHQQAQAVGHSGDVDDTTVIAILQAATAAAHRQKDGAAAGVPVAAWLLQVLNFGGTAGCAAGGIVRGTTSPTPCSYLQW
jgi:hypothetical protein